MVLSVLSRQQLNSETLPADFAGEVFHSHKNGPTAVPVSEGFVDVGLDSTLEKPSSHKENYIRTSILSKYARSCRRFGRSSKPTDVPFLEDYQKSKILKPTKTEDSDSLLIREGTISFVYEA